MSSATFLSLYGSTSAGLDEAPNPFTSGTMTLKFLETSALTYDTNISLNWLF